MAAKSSPAAEFHRISNEFLAESWTRYPEWASSLGLAEYNDKLGENSLSALKAQNGLVQRTLADLEALPESSFFGDDYLDRRGMLSMLRSHVILEEQFDRSRKNPNVHVQNAIQSVFDLVVRHQDRLETVLPAIEARLTGLSAYLVAALKGVRNPIPLWTTMAIEGCDGGVVFFEDIRSILEQASDDPNRTGEAVRRGQAALNEFSRGIRRKEPGPEGGFALGADLFSHLVREQTGLDVSVAEIEANGHELVRKLSADLADEARRLKKGADPASILAAAADEWLPERPLIDEYRETTRQVHDRLVELDLVTMPRGESLDVLPVPVFLRHQFPTAAYNQPPAFSRRQVGIFWVNDLSLGETSAAKKRAEIRQHFGLELTAAHEAYPGHHLQFAIQNRHPSKLRRLFAHAIFYEGWTLWCERMCIDQGLVDLKVGRLMQLNDALWRAHRIVIDCGLHTGRLSYNAACKVLMDGVGFTRARAQGDVNWYTFSPTVPMSYLLGRLEVERLHRHFVSTEGWSLKTFNDWILSHGAIPWRWIMDARLRGRLEQRK